MLIYSKLFVYKFIDFCFALFFKHYVCLKSIKYIFYNKIALYLLLQLNFSAIDVVDYKLTNCNN